MSEVSVHPRATADGKRHWQYDFRVTLPDGSVYRERRKARGAHTEAAARRIGEGRLREVLRAGPPRRGGQEPGPHARPPTVARFAEEWLELCRAERQSPNTLANKSAMLRTHIVPLLGDLRLDAIGEAEITTLRRQRAALKASSVNLIVRTLQVMLRRAGRLGYRVQVPAVKRLPERRERHWYTLEDLEKLVAAAATFGPLYAAIVLLGGDAGLRAGEMAALRWADVDFGTATLHVRNNLVAGADRPPKSGKSREVPMTRRLREALQQLRAREGRDARVLRRVSGKAFITPSLRAYIARVARYAGVPVYGPHALRHSFGTRLFLRGTGAQVAMELLGHAKLATTQVYAHASADHRKAAIDRLVP